MEVLMHYDQTSPLNDRYHERGVDISDPTDERMSPDRVHWLRPGTTDRPAFKNYPSASNRPSTARRIFRRFVRFFFAVLIGAVATLGWQSYGDDAKEIVRTWDPSLDWLLPPSVAKSPAPVTSAEVQQQLKPMALDVALLRRSVEQVAATVDQLGRKADQMAQNIATMQAAEQQLIQKVSSPAPSKPIRVPPPSASRPEQ
jgi:hypothetical protein